MHGDKRWIRDHKGRLKKSSDRTFKDWLGDLNAEEYKYILNLDCPDCKELSDRYDMSIYYVRCDKCREVQDKRWYGKGYPGGPRKKWYDEVPSWFRRDLNRKYRTKVRQMMRDAKYNEDLYDMLPPPKKDAAWLWW